MIYSATNIVYDENKDIKFVYSFFIKSKNVEFVMVTLVEKWAF